MVSLVSTDPGIIAPSVGSSLKRKHTDTDIDTGHVPSSPTKRQRVKFDSHVDIRILPDWDEKSPELVGEEVRRAIERHLDGENIQYDNIRSLLTAKPTSSGAPLSRILQRYIIALTNNVPLLNHRSNGLVHAIVDCNWIARNDQFVRSYKHLLRSLISVQPGYTPSVLQMLVKMFVDQPPPHLRQQDDPEVQRPRLQSRVHEVLRYLLKQNIMNSSHLCDIFSSSFPFPTDSLIAHMKYIKNVLRVTEYCPEIRGEILALITDRLVKIDVSVQTDIEDLDDDIEDHLIKAEEDKQEEKEDDKEDTSDETSDSDEDILNDEEKRLKELKDSVAKLDAIMDLLFEYYDGIFARGNLDEVDDTFSIILSQFANLILPTYRSRHVQFLLFHLSQCSPELIDQFAGCCSHIAFDYQKPHLLRISAAAYLASFIARGAHVSTEVVRDVFDLLCHHLESMRLSQEPACKGPNLSRHGIYYAISQALLYTFCFRWRDLIVTPDDVPVTDEDLCDGLEFQWYSNIQEILRRNIFCRLNPLKVCSPSIVTQFARIAHYLKFLYVFPLMETNKRIRLSRALTSGYMDGVAARETALTMKTGESSFLLDAYFPFDPYTLPKSKRWLKDDYVVWKPVPGMQNSNAGQDDDDNDDEEDEDEDEDESDNESNVATAAAAAPNVAAGVAVDEELDETGSDRSS